MASTIYNKNNMSTADVKKMQQALVDAGYSVGSAGVDGIWGKDTEKALSQFKKDTGGSNSYGTTVGNETFNKLYGTGSASGGSSNKGGSTGGATAGSSGINWGTTAAPNATVNASGMTIPGTNLTVGATAEGVDAHKLGTFNYENYLTGIDTLNQGFDSHITQLQSGAGNANAALEEARSNALAGIKSTYDDSARNYYRLYRTQEKELPEQLSSIGATGGATESAALRLMNNYSDNLYKNETARNQDVNGLNQDYNEAIAKNSMQIAQQIADAYLQKAQALQGMQADFAQSQKDVYSSYMQNAAAQAAAQKEAREAAQKEAQAAALTARNNNVHANELKRQNEGYTTAHWTDGNGEYHYRITGKKKVTKSGSGGSGGSGGSDKDKPIEEDKPKKSDMDISIDASDNSDVNSVNAQVLLRALDPSNANIFSGTYLTPGNNLTGAAIYAANANIPKEQKKTIWKNALGKYTSLYGGK